MRLPAVTRSLRFRLSGITTAVAFGIGGLALGVTYVAVLMRVRDLTMRTLVFTRQVVEVNGRPIVLPEVTEQEFRTVESLVREYLLNQVAIVTVVVLAGLFLLSLAVGWFVAGRALRPLDRMTQVAQDIEANDLSRRISLEGPDDELTRMARTFDGMLDRLDRAFSAQRSFLAQTSHDLRTPLSVIRSNLDVTMSDRTASAEEWRETGEIVSRAAERMSTMIDDLLAAARLEVEAARRVSLDLSQIVAEAAGEARASAERSGVAIAVDSARVIVEGDPTALSRALGNLIDNALRVSPPRSEVTLGAGVHEGWAFMAVADHGPGFDPSLVERVTGRRGLGLGIVREIAGAHDGHLQTIPRPGGGSLVIVWLPQAGSRPDHDPDPGRLRMLHGEHATPAGGSQASPARVVEARRQR